MGLSTNMTISHSNAAIPIMQYTMLLATVAGPNKNVTKLKPNRPTSPQFKAPINVNGFKI